MASYKAFRSKNIAEMLKLIYFRRKKNKNFEGFWLSEI